MDTFTRIMVGFGRAWIIVFLSILSTVSPEDITNEKGYWIIFILLIICATVVFVPSKVK